MIEVAKAESEEEGLFNFQIEQARMKFLTDANGLGG